LLRRRFADKLLCARRAEEAVQVHPCSVNYGLARFDSRYLVRRRLGHAWQARTSAQELLRPYIPGRMLGRRRAAS
jgi:hypothetical protein